MGSDRLIAAPFDHREWSFHFSWSYRYRAPPARRSRRRGPFDIRGSPDFQSHLESRWNLFLRSGRNTDGREKAQKPQKSDSAPCGLSDSTELPFLTRNRHSDILKSWRRTSNFGGTTGTPTMPPVTAALSAKLSRWCVARSGTKSERREMASGASKAAVPAIE